jgi:uncharacterized protein YdiU (UPF0061 family)
VILPFSASHRPAPRFTALGPQFADVAEIARFPSLDLRFRNQRWAERIGLGELTDDEWRAAFGLFEPLPDNLAEPLALRYHGHQFRQYNAALGDGRGFLYAQVLDDRDRLLDLGTKGSGQTMWSRGGDGRLTLKGGVREVLATEMLEALGVYTSKTFSLYETGESLERNDEPSPTRAGVLVRLGHSHIRFGSFQRHAFHDDRASLDELLAFSIDHYAPELCCPADHAAPMFFRLIVQRSARLCAQWMVAGFVHGVLNTDNMNVTGESFDYGPYRFLPTFDPTFTAAYFDHSGLYSYANQPTAVRWNLEQLAAALEPVARATDLRVIAAEFQAAYSAELQAAVLRRLGVQPRGEPYDRLLSITVFDFLHRSQVGFEQFFFDWYGGPVAGPRADRSPAAERYRDAASAQLRHDLAGYEPAAGARLDHPYFDRAGPCTMLIDEIESLWDSIAERDDWAPFEAKIDEVRAMGEALR